MGGDMKKIGCLATYDKRRYTRDEAINSLIGQLDFLYVIDNEVQPVNMKDNAKFVMLDKVQEPCYMFLLDDDILYPSDYVERSIEAIETHQNIITYHGRQLIGYGKEYFKGHKWFRCFDKVDYDCILDVCGTGVTAFRTDYFHPKGLANAEDKGMADLIFSLEAAKQKKVITLLNHEAGWIKPIHNEETLYRTERQKGASRQIELADEIFKLNHDND